MDKFYTPDKLAKSAIDWFGESFTPTSAVDFAAGEGALLAAVRRRWASCLLYANDTDRTALSLVKSRLPGVATSCSDFLHLSSRTGSPLLRKLTNQKVDLIVLNPPFSNRGGNKHKVMLDGISVSCGRALAFLITALPFLSQTGKLFALLPASCFSSDRDDPAMQLLRQRYEFHVAVPPTQNAFPGCSVEVTGVVLTRRVSSLVAPFHPAKTTNPGQTAVRVTIRRGTIPVKSKVPQKGVEGRFVHTTGLKNNQLVLGAPREALAHQLIHDRCILIPRVGRWNSGKVCLHDGAYPIVLSDCVIALSTRSAATEAWLINTIAENWQEFSNLYGGSCAPYLTIRKLQLFFESKGALVSSHLSDARERVSLAA